MPKSSAEEAIVRSELVIDQKLRTMPGWTKAFVQPPWEGTAPQCRGCGRDPAKTDVQAPGFRFTLAALTKPDEERKCIFYSFALVDESCAKDKKVMAKISDEAFTALALAQGNGGS
jgi:hypothetical protein